MSKSLRKILALVLVLVMVAGIAACGKKEETPATNGDPAPSTNTDPEPVKEVSYTFNDYSSSLANNWNPHTWETNADRAVLAYVAAPVIDYSIEDSENGVFQWVYEMADSVEDVTAQHQDDLTKYGVTLAEGKTPETTTEGYVYEFKLNQ